MKAVLDTNILVSALLTPNGNPARILDYVLNGTVVMCYDSRLIAEYLEVLLQPKFAFNQKAINQVIDFILHSGVSVVPEPSTIYFEDHDDKKFYEVAKSVQAFIITGNIKHFPAEPMIVTPAEFLNIAANRQELL